MYQTELGFSNDLSSALSFSYKKIMEYASFFYLLANGTHFLLVWVTTRIIKWTFFEPILKALPINFFFITCCHYIKKYPLVQCSESSHVCSHYFVTYVAVLSVLHNVLTTLHKYNYSETKTKFVTNINTKCTTGTAFLQNNLRFFYKLAKLFTIFLLFLTWCMQTIFLWFRNTVSEPLLSLKGDNT